MNVMKEKPLVKKPSLIARIALYAGIFLLFSWFHDTQIKSAKCEGRFETKMFQTKKINGKETLYCVTSLRPSIIERY